MDENDQLKVKKAWEVALAPAKSLPMNVFMSYMSGNSLQIVPIMMTSMMFFMTPFKQILKTNEAFSNLESKNNSSDIQVTKLVYIVCHLLAVGVGIWKLGMMGLLPNTRSDWLAWETQSSILEKSF
ncbi:hypothetical protein TRICI_000629 [Trichomonascus ciferrii]|uniref:ER membrane protein complex subunit 4 n=1 Tax=Trichomonascus ciferrii TaxID=44093 RepID=A0A642VC39_9ASCO|nr:hypothetical protein TRICI_000629 [Trichomonascus ciferrii]